MGNVSLDQVVTDPDVFGELSAAQRVLAVLRMSGRTPEQTEAMMGRHTLIGAMVNNILICRDPALQDKCTCHRDRLESELDANWVSLGNAQWSNAETIDLIIAAAKSSLVPPLLMRHFDRIAISEMT